MQIDGWNPKDIGYDTGYNHTYGVGTDADAKSTGVAEGSKGECKTFYHFHNNVLLCNNSPLHLVLVPSIYLMIQIIMRLKLLKVLDTQCLF